MDLSRSVKDTEKEIQVTTQHLQVRGGLLVGLSSELVSGSVLTCKGIENKT